MIPRSCLLTTALLLPGPLGAQDGSVNVPQAVLQTIGDLLPESSNAGAAYVSEVYSPNLVVSEPATVQLVFLHEGAGYRNSLGYFLYEELPGGGVAVLEAGLLIADASFPPAGSLVSGDTFELRDEAGEPRVFQPGERVGFFLVADGWNRIPVLRDGALDGLAIPATTPAGNALLGRGCYTSLDRLNPEFASPSPERARHLAMLWMPGQPGFLGGDPFLVCGFEDLDRNGNSDEDFNDLVFVVDATPIEAIAGTEAFSFAEGDPDGDGVVGILDHYPLDPRRARVSRYPASGDLVLGFEDQYPGLGDADYNDVVLAYHVETVKSAAGEVTDLLLTHHLVARGAGYEHSVDLRFPLLGATRTGTARVERFLGDGAGTHQEPVTFDLADLRGTRQGCIELFPSTRDALPPLPGATFTNTQSGTVDRPAASVRVHVAFDVPVPVEELGLPPFDLFVSVHHGEERWDVHLPGHAPLEGRPAHLPADPAFLDEEGRPWLLEVPRLWRFPLEQQRVWNCYPRYTSWVAAAGAEDADWYDHPAPAATIGPELVAFLPGREWALSLPPANQP